MKTTNMLLVMLILVSSFPTPGCQLDPAPRADLVIVGGTFIVSTGENEAGNTLSPQVENAIIIIRDGRITDAGPQSHIPFPKGGETLDARGKWIALGTIDEYGTQRVHTDPEVTLVKKILLADLLILETDPRVGGKTPPKVFKVIRAGKVIETGNLDGQKQP